MSKNKLVVTIELDESDVELILDNDPHEIISVIQMPVVQAMMVQGWKLTDEQRKYFGVEGE